MTLDRIGESFQGTAWYFLEGSYGDGGYTSGATSAGTSYAISCKIQNVRIDSGDRHKVLRDIGSPLACHLLELTKEPKVHLEYIPQCDDTLIDIVVDRTSQCTLKSLAMVFGMNVFATDDTDNISYYQVVGMKPSTVRITGSKDTEYLVVIDFDAKSIVTSEATSTITAFGIAPTALTGAYLQFNTAGEITKTGGQVVNTNHIAFVTNAVEITISHKLTGYTDHNSTEKTFLAEGEMDVEGSVDITLDGGGARHFSEVFANKAFDLQIDMGGSGCPRITLPACEWKSTTVEKNVGGEAMMHSVPFTCKPSACNNIVSAAAA